MRHLLWLIIVAVFCMMVVCSPIGQVFRSFSWYDSKSLEPLPEVSLSGKIIMIDPGHGVVNSGAVGKHGTKENAINFAVACKLKNMLENKGATVFLTRDTDNSEAYPESLTNRHDLLRRARYRDSLGPDLFVSIHHNGTEDGSRKKNESVTFYAQGDAYGSFDVAQSVSIEFSELLGLGSGELQGGNYFILRNPRIPTILGEPSYLSNPKMERILNDTAALQWEATAYFRGIVKWFSRGVPKITGFSIDTIKNMVTVEISSDVPLDSLLTSVCFDEYRLFGKITDHGYTATLPSTLKNGNHTIRCIAGNTNGNLSSEARFVYTVNRSARQLIVSIDRQVCNKISCLRITAHDCYGYPVKDGTPIVMEQNDTSRTIDGMVLFYVSVKCQPVSVHVACGSVCVDTMIRADTGSVDLVQGFVGSNNADFKVGTCIFSYGEMICAPDRNGFFTVVADTGSQTSVFSAPGFLDTAVILRIGELNQIALSPRAGGVLFGKRITIDPEFGGAESGGVSKHGIRAGDINKKIAADLEGVLCNYGGVVLNVRPENRTIHSTQRVLMADIFSADVYIVIRSDSVKQKPYISYCPGSIAGKKIADYIRRQWCQYTGDTVECVEESTPVMRQVQAPAVTVSFSPLESFDPFERKNITAIVMVIVNGVLDFYSK